MWQISPPTPFFALTHHLHCFDEVNVFKKPLFARKLCVVQPHLLFFCHCASLHLKNEFVKELLGVRAGTPCCYHKPQNKRLVKSRLKRTRVLFQKILDSFIYIQLAWMHTAIVGELRVCWRVTQALLIKHIHCSSHWSLPSSSSFTLSGQNLAQVSLVPPYCTILETGVCLWQELLVSLGFRACESALVGPLHR